MNQTSNRNVLFRASCLALIVTSMTFAVRAKLEGVLETDFQLTGVEIGLAFAPAFWGFTIAMLIGGPLVDYFGIKKIVWVAFFSHAIGILLTIFSYDFNSFFVGTMFIGIGNGMVEAACNPLVASLYPENKAKMLNRFHVWFPGGIVVGGVIGYLLMDVMNLPWQVLVGVLFIPLLTYGFLFFGKTLPKTERVQMGVSNAQMWKGVISPLFLLMAFCMLLTASTELSTNQRIEGLLKDANVSGILILVFINGIMAIGRGFAGPVVKRLDTTGMLLFSAVFSCLGLILLSKATGTAVFGAAFVFAVGVTYFWPTMLSFVAERIPESGALGLSIMGGLGMLSVSIVLPIMGSFMDEASGASTFMYMAILPAILIVIFTMLFLKFRHNKMVR
ncbi:MFS transporter [Echinicola strongylocentroti]|uniref:MFS transporter n=1 Tax=Echinicola strongylocentroti TaxID=1795355 RepID=A0A2Z4IG72_9BACT|nr:MFS transporter [Echinicola strongylocentroti]AWW29709.1 MFS transporter [Echinicola strongylocentroti]